MDVPSRLPTVGGIRPPTLDFDRTQPITYPPQPFEFTGSGSEYFRIWIVNLLLAILTLGIHSAWGKVRKLQYFYRHTRVAGGVFDYHGDPIAILKGRILAFVLLVSYSLAKEAPGWPLVIAVVAIAALMPWLLRNSFRFRLRNSSYRGLRFSFRGSVGEAYRVFLGYGLLTLITLYILAPLFHQRLKAYQHGQAWFGRSPFSFNAAAGSFFGVYMQVGLVMLGGFIAVAAVFGSSIATLSQAQGRPDLALLGPILVGMVVAFIALSLVAGPLFTAKIGNLVWNNTELGEHRFQSRLQVGRLFVIQASNFILVLLTLGLYTPWAAVRVARYRAQCLTLLPAGTLDAFIADAVTDVTATGEETAEMFDFDIGL